MTLEEQAVNYLDRAQPYVDAGTANPSLAGEITAFLNSNRAALAGLGRGDLVDQLDAAWGWLSGNGPGDPQADQSSTMAGLKSYAADPHKFDTQYFGEAWDNTKKKILSDPVLLGAAVLAAVFVAAYAWRALK